MQSAHHLQQLKPSYLREILRAANSPGMLSLAGGLPAEESFPMARIQTAFANAAQKPELFQYGYSAGYPPLIDSIQERFSFATDNDVIVCNGSQQALDLVVRAYLNPGDAVALESPAYLGAIQVFMLASAKQIEIAQVADGPDIERLESTFKNTGVKLFYAVPDFHNPSGTCWSLEKRKAVAQLCQRYGVVLIEDSPYRDLRFCGKQLPLVSEFCPEWAVLLRSFSKTVSPGMRLGALIASADKVTEIIKVKQAADLHTSGPMQYVLQQILDDSCFAEHLRSTAALYAARYQGLTQTLNTLLPECRFQSVEGGMFIWLRLPSACDSRLLANACLEHHVAIVPGTVFFPNKQCHGQQFARLNFSHLSIDDISTAVHRIAKAMRRTIRRT